MYKADHRSKIAFIGGGNMAAALIGGLCAHGWPANKLRVAERDDERRRWLVDKFGVQGYSKVADAADNANAIILAVKPQQMADAVNDLIPPPDCTVLSIAAGTRMETIRLWLGPDCAIIRAMPNTPALAGAGATGLYAEAGTPASARALAELLVNSVGLSFWVDGEDQLDVVTALSGSGPAYFLLLVEIMTQAATAMGLPPVIAKGLARQTLIGTARLLEQEPESPGALRERITSKGGTTAAAVRILEKGGFHTIVESAMLEAAKRSRELGSAMSNRT